MAYEQIEHMVWVDQHVISFEDPEGEWDGSWTNDAFGKELGIGVGEGVVSMVDFAHAAGNVPMLFEIHAEAPAADDVEDYEGVLEASIRLPSRKLSIANESGRQATISLPDAIDWRLRAYFANGDTGRYDYGDGAEHARIVLYPGPSAPIAVLKARQHGGDVIREYRGKRSDAELWEMLVGPNVSHRCLATVALLQKGRLDLVRPVVAKPDAVRRIFASTVWFAGPAAEPILAELATDADPEVRARVAQSIAFLGANALRPILETLKQDTEGHVSEAAQDALQDLEQGGTR